MLYSLIAGTNGHLHAGLKGKLQGLRDAPVKSTHAEQTCNYSDICAMATKGMSKGTVEGDDSRFRLFSINFPGNLSYTYGTSGM